MIYDSRDASLAGSAPLPVGPSDIGQTYYIPCDADITFTVLLSGFGYRLSKETLVIKTANGSCTGTIEGWTDSTVTNYLLGSRFISTVYVCVCIFIWCFSIKFIADPAVLRAFQIGQPPAAQQQVGIAQRDLVPPAKKAIVGAIVGGVIGGLGLLIVIGGVVWWFKRRGKTPSTSAKMRETQQLKSSHDKSPFEDLGHRVDHWTPPPISSVGTPTESYYHNIPTSPNTPPSSAAYKTKFSDTSSPLRTETSEGFLLPELDTPPVKQWVTNLTPTSAIHSPTSAVPTMYDYGNDGQPGTLFSPSSPDGFGRGG